MKRAVYALRAVEITGTLVTVGDIGFNPMAGVPEFEGIMFRGTEAQCRKKQDWYEQHNFPAKLEIVELPPELLAIEQQRMDDFRAELQK